MNVIPDRLARRLWIITSLIAVSVTPLFQLTVIDYTNWNEETANATAALIVMWSGSIASVLGLSRYAPSGTVRNGN